MRLIFTLNALLAFFFRPFSFLSLATKRCTSFFLINIFKTPLFNKTPNNNEINQTLPTLLLCVGLKTKEACPLR